MTVSAPFDWMTVRLVAFDVDGTLYAQRLLRLRMALELLVHTARSGDLRILRVIRSFRRLREHLAEHEVANFVPELISRTADACGVADAEVSAIAAEWIERRPLRHLAACRHEGLLELFGALHRCGKSIGILSDYPAAAKLEALGLAADHIVCSEDAAIGVLKPHPKGLLALMRAAKATPEATVLIGDRPDRDGRAANRASVRALIRSPRAIDGWSTFRRFDDPLFRPILQG